MNHSTNEHGPTPDRSEAIPKSYAINVDAEGLTVWQYQVDIADPGGDWQFVEYLDREDDPKLNIDYATPKPPSEDGYWIYARSYDCEFDCE